MVEYDSKKTERKVIGRMEQILQGIKVMRDFAEKSIMENLTLTKGHNFWSNLMTQIMRIIFI